MLYRSSKHRAGVGGTPSGQTFPRAKRVRTVDRLAMAACTAMMGTLASHAGAASWDPVPGIAGPGDGIVQGGGGLWNLFSPNWTNDGGFNNSTWVDFDFASFGGVSGGLVSLTNGGINTTSITFDPTSDFSLYNITSQTTADVLNLAGSGQIVTNQDATISAIVGGNVGLTKFGAGTLTLAGLNSFSGPVNVFSGKLRVNDIGNLGAASSIAIANGATFEAGNPLTFNGAVSTVAGGGFISLANPSGVVTLAGTLSGSDPLTINGAGGGALLVNNPANFTGSGNLFTGNVTLLGGGSATFAYPIQAQAGQVYAASAGTLTLGNSVPGAIVGLSAGSLVQASGPGVVQLNGRASGPGIGVSVAGDLSAVGGGRIIVGDGLDDSAQIVFAGTSHLTADAGTIVLRPRATPLTLDFGTTASLSIRNGGMLSLAGNADLVLNRDVDQSGAWVLANQSSNLFRITGFSQGSTAGLTLRADSGVTRYEVDSITLGGSQANGSVAVDMRGGTIDINNFAAGRVFNYEPGYVVSGWGQLGTVAANQTHVIPFGGATFYANAPAAIGGTLCIVGAFNESFGSKAAFRIGDNNTLMLTSPNPTFAPYSVGSVLIDPQGPASVARFVVNTGAISASSAAFVNANNRMRFEVQNGGTLTSDIGSTGSLLVNGVGSLPINVTGGSTFITTSPTFLLQPNETIGTSGTLFGFNGVTPTTLTLNGLVDLNGTLGGTISGNSTGTIKLDAGESLTLTGAADLSKMTLGYGGLSAASALLDVNAPASNVRIGTGTGLTTPFGPFGGMREFKVTSGTLQVDAADASSVSISGVNQLSVDRTSNATVDPALVGTLTLNGGSFQIGTTASTNTIAAGGLFSGRGTLGHATAIDTLINFGTVRASGGPLTVSAVALRGNGAWDPNGQAITLSGGGFSDVSGSSQTVLKLVGAAGGTVQLGAASTHTGGTVIDGSAGSGAVALKVIAGGALGSGAVTLNGGVLQINSESSLTFTNPINVIGTATSGIGFDHLTSASSKTETVGPLSIGGQTVFLNGPATNAYTYTLVIGGTTVGPAGASIINTGGSSSSVKLGALTLNGNLSLATGSTNFVVDVLSGTGSITRNSSTGTVIFSKPASGFTGNYFSSVGTTNFTAPSTLGNGTYQFANGTYNINVGGGGALSGAAGSMQLGSLNLNTANALDGTFLNFTGGNLFTAVGGSLGTGTIQLNGGKMFLRSDAGAVFGGTINVSGISGTNNTGSLTVDRASAAGTGGTHTIAGLNLVDQSLIVTAGNAGYGLAVSGATTIGGSVGGTVTNNAAVINWSSLALNAPLTLAGGGNWNIGALSGTRGMTFNSSGTLTFTAAAQPGFTGGLTVNTGTVNMNNAASLAGGAATINGGTLNVGVANGLASTQITLLSGFLNANVANALNGATVPVSNGTLFAAANNALGNATINMSGGNLTATVPGALGTSNISLSNAILALRSDTAAGFGGSVTLTGSGFSTVSVAKLTDFGGTGNGLSINNLTLGGQTLNVTGADNDVFTVINPVTMTGSAPTTINTTAADALFQGALTGAGALVKNGVRSLRLDGGGTFGATTVNAGALIVNNVWNTAGVTVGGTSGAATLQMGGAGLNATGNLTINAGTLRIAKANISDAIQLASALTVGTNGDVRVEYAGQTASTLANSIVVDTSLAARALTLAATSGGPTTQGSTFTVGAPIVKSGANALNVVAQGDTALDDGFNALVRPPSRLVMGPNQTFQTDLVFNGGIVIGKGNVLAGSGASPFGTSANPLNLNVTDSTVGAMVADGTSSAQFTKTVNTLGPRKRLGAFFNPAGLVGTVQTVNFTGSFTWNDGTTPLYVMIPGGNVAGAAAVSPWNGIIVDPGTMLQVNSGAALDNILTSTATTVTSTAPVYVGGGGTVRFTTGIARTLSQAKGLAGTVTVLDNTLFQSNTTGQHFDGVELRTGTYQTGTTTAQTLSGGFAVNASPFDPSRTTSNLITDSDLNLNGVGAAQAFRIGFGQTLAKSGTGTVNVNGDQLHGLNSTLQVNAGMVNLNTDAGMNNGGTPVNNLTLSANNGATVNLAVTQHMAQVSISGNAQVKLSSTAPKVLDVTSVSALGGKLDLTSNRLIVDYGAGFGSPMSSVRQQIISGYNASGTLWTGNGIMSSTAAATPFNTGIGYAEASDVLGPTGGVFGGENVDGSSVVARYTKLGDANLDGSVDFLDLARMAQSYNTTVSGVTDSWWARGDFNYDGVVDFNDLAKLAQNYNTALPGGAVPASGSADFASDVAAAFAQAPEPGTIGVLGVLGAGALLRRSRRARDRDSRSLRERRYC